MSVFVFLDINVFGNFDGSVGIVVRKSNIAFAVVGGFPHKQGTVVGKGQFPGQNVEGGRCAVAFNGDILHFHVLDGCSVLFGLLGGGNHGETQLCQLVLEVDVRYPRIVL